MLDTPTVLILLLGVSVAYLIQHLARSNRTGRPLPPGPKGLPLLGNVNDLPKPGMLECHHWLEHKELYGEISSITVLGQTFIIINDAQLALELLRDRPQAHAARPHMVFSSDMIGWNNTLAMSQYTDVFKKHRSNIAKVAGSTTSLNVFNRVQEEESVHFLLNVLESPEKLFDHIKKEAGAVILKITYGYTAEPKGKDILVDMAGQTMHEFSESTIPGKWPVDVMPFLRYLPEWMPGTAFKKTARDMAAQLQETTERPYAFVKQQMREKKHKTSFLSQALEELGSDPDMERIHKWSASSMYLGGADTTVSALMTFFLAMTLFPDVQKKAQEELDSVLGSDLAASGDRDKLPYLWAVVLETHRWHPVAPMGLPHAATKEDMIRGYRIPKGALLLPNNWWFTHDPAVYPDPMEFRPERFIETPTHKAEPDPRTWTFGYGRRVCPGRYVADNALFLTIAQSLAVFKIEPLVENGKVVMPEVKFEPGVVSHPVPYRTSITPRSEEHKQRIVEAEKEYPWEESDAKALKSLKW
ncbi:hypothetical protein HBI56_185850 [Parastagonospora nodorum]|uniref:O-methylsterigmatocystin oxidoreductase n=2 Tax=Phaeosphaeria nodorum (strain SN15 / ATCC MYA-4574 / FGSC 10173) TaxID=321614 RepID=A0A7U2IB15_PHANO|nr:hypothetical protein SNOG_11884 [Parastagonospora nodorum SN15]KAH3909369.1 hypothetical protein HBH56_163730 [Parastagonospora nodorum]EAT80928.1 hypothetical protein SNOG_11884 [Parastagonospora nodorum SN15]KAH3932143.1 hypothetical protein HBH54_085510 [Parastagonospora nodorum]KAH3947482.1 hypothetical protein HBH53_112780 [Parastagonospora nodorum]KAH3969019.1 hypothetical protein HBH52_177110 [Parastagonospora nodorum]